MSNGPIPETMPDEFDLPMLLAGIPKGYACWDTTTGSPFRWMVPAGVRRVFFMAKGGDSGSGSAQAGCPPIVTSFDVTQKGAHIMHVENLEPGAIVTITVGAGGVGQAAGGDTTIALPSGKGTVTAKGAGRGQVNVTSVGALTIAPAITPPRATGANILNEDNDAVAAGTGMPGWVVAMW